MVPCFLWGIWRNTLLSVRRHTKSSSKCSDHDKGNMSCLLGIGYRRIRREDAEEKEHESEEKYEHNHTCACESSGLLLQEGSD